MKVDSYIDYTGKVRIKIYDVDDWGYGVDKLEMVLVEKYDRPTYYRAFRQAWSRAFNAQAKADAISTQIEDSIKLDIEKEFKEYTFVNKEGKKCFDYVAFAVGIVGKNPARRKTKVSREHSKVLSKIFIGKNGIDERLRFVYSNEDIFYLKGVFNDSDFSNAAEEIKNEMILDLAGVINV